MKTSKNELERIGVFGGTFDPPHVGHVEISKFVIKKLKLSLLIWAVTKKNPFKRSPYSTLKKDFHFQKKKWVKSRK